MRTFELGADEVVVALVVLAALWTSKPQHILYVVSGFAPKVKSLVNLSFTDTERSAAELGLAGLTSE